VEAVEQGHHDLTVPLSILVGMRAWVTQQHALHIKLPASCFETFRNKSEEFSKKSIFRVQFDPRLAIGKVNSRTMLFSQKSA
jgi:hypothetical protein